MQIIIKTFIDFVEDFLNYIIYYNNLPSKKSHIVWALMFDKLFRDSFNEFCINQPGCFNCEIKINCRNRNGIN